MKNNMDRTVSGQDNNLPADQDNQLKSAVTNINKQVSDTMNNEINKFDHLWIETKWQDIWEKEKTFSINLKEAKKPFYNLMMFPYPSAEWLHVGNFYAFTGADTYWRFKKMQWNDVFEPIWFDAFWIHSENFAIKKNIHPKTLVANNIKTFKFQQLKKLWALYDWDYEVNTTTPEYYKWNQWLFIKMFEEGLAYKKKSLVNWCPDCMTVISDEQVINGKCERHWETTVEKRELDQWFFKITEYAKELYDSLSEINWSEKTVTAQKNWINKKKWTVVKFDIAWKDEAVEVFTTRVDTLYWVTFLAISPDSKLAKEAISEEQTKELQTMIGEQISNKDLKEKKWIKTSMRVIHPLTKQEIPVYVANYVISEYGTWAVMWVPAHDDRDMEFAEKFWIEVIKTYDEENDKLVNSEWLDWLSKSEAIKKLNEHLAKIWFWWEDTRYKLRDWCISRQRYWWAPIPMINCEKCWVVPEKIEQLPVRLPEVENWRPKWDWHSPLANIPEFYETSCPCCWGPAKRETDVMDNFVDSAFYFFRYIDPKNPNEMFDKELGKKWIPVDMYIWWHEHAVLHLLYTRFITKVLNRLWYTDAKEPFKRFFAHWLLLKDWIKMSKSKWNVVNPDDLIAQYGSDTLRTYLMFMWPLEQGWDYSDKWIVWVNKFIKRIYALLTTNEISADDSKTDEIMLNLTVKSTTEAFELLKYNVWIARCMEYYNFLAKKEVVTKREWEVLIKLLAPLAPHFTEELWQNVLWNKGSIHLSWWPIVDSSVNLIRQTINMPVQINWKLKWTIEVDKDIEESELLEVIKWNENMHKAIDWKEIRKVIFVKWKIINIVV